MIEIPNSYLNSLYTQLKQPFVRRPHGFCPSFPYAEFRSISTGEISTFLCNNWSCPVCAPKRKIKVQSRMQQWAVEKKATRFLTLTLSPRHIGPEALLKAWPAESAGAQGLRLQLMRDGLDWDFIESECVAFDYNYKINRIEELLYECSGYRQQKYRVNFNYGTVESRLTLRKLYLSYIQYVWNKFRTASTRKFGSFSYILFKEFHKDNIRPHLHILFNAPEEMSEEWVAETFPKYGGGRKVKIVKKETLGSIDKIVGYVVKYLGKSLGEGYPRGFRRYVVSQDIKLNQTPSTYAEYSLYASSRKLQPLIGLDGQLTSCVKGLADSVLYRESFSQCDGCPQRKHNCKFAPPTGYTLHDLSLHGFVHAPCEDNNVLINELIDILPEWVHEWRTVEYSKIDEGGKRTHGYARKKVWVRTDYDRNFLPPAFLEWDLPEL